MTPIGHRATLRLSTLARSSQTPLTWAASSARRRLSPIVRTVAQPPVLSRVDRPSHAPERHPPHPPTVFTALRAALSAPPSASTPPRWVYVPYDQLTTEIGPAAAGPAEVGLVLVENPAKAARRPYHRQKLALLLASQRHFAVEAREKGYAVRIFVGGSRDRDLGDGISEVPSSGSTGDILAAVVRVLGPLTVMTPAERELRKELRALREDGSLRYVPHVGWLSTAEDFERVGQNSDWRSPAIF